MTIITKCKCCGSEFKKTNKTKKAKSNPMKKGNRNFVFCSAECYWKHKLRDILPKEANK